jgi:hypothetical protein
MDDVAGRPAAQRSDLFVAAGAELGLNPALIEKDFWVCWVLKRIFTLPGFEGAFVFKGGTSLSKVYNAIDRFSEDVDLVWDRESLGFGGEKNPLADSVSQTQAEKVLIPALIAASQVALRERLVPALTEAVTGMLPATQSWRISIKEDADQPSVVFDYPQAGGVLSRYVRPCVLLEFVPRSEPIPSAEATIRPYLWSALEGVCKEPDVRVRHITVARTFWEKATILHMYHHYPEGKEFGARFSRHYYDTYRLFQTGHAAPAMTDLDLLRSVVRHKKRFYRSGPARYDEAVAGRLCLVPPATRLETLRADYAAMSEMFFGTPPPFEEMIEVLRQIEEQVNRLTAPPAEPSPPSG